MKSILKVLVTVLAFGVVTAAPALAAQEKKGGRGGMNPEQQIERLETAVGTLSAEQKTKITAIYAKAADDRQALSAEERGTKGMEIMKSVRTKVRAVLTSDQQAKFDAMPQGGAGGKGGGKKKKDQ